MLAELFGFQMYGKLKPVLVLVSNEEERFLVTLEFQSCKLEFAVSQPGVPFGKWWSLIMLPCSGIVEKGS